MKSRFGLFLFFLSILIFSGLSTGQITNTKDNKINISIAADINSRYLWRGFTFSEGVVFQPTATFIYRNFNLNIWSNFDLKKNEDSPLFNEYDIIFYYSYYIKNLEIQPFVQFYIYPGSEELSTGEFTLSTAYNFKNFKFLTSHNIDFLNYKGAYYGTAGAGFENEIHRKMFFDCGASLGWANSKFNETYGGIDKNAINHMSCNIGFTYYPVEIIYTKLRFELSNLLDKDLRELNNTQPIINWGLSLGVEL